MEILEGQRKWPSVALAAKRMGKKTLSRQKGLNTFDKETNMAMFHKAVYFMSIFSMKQSSYYTIVLAKHN